MTMSYNGRLFAAKVEDAALKFVAWSTAPEPLARAAEQLSYGPPRASSQALVGMYKDGKTPMAPHLPTAPENLKSALAIDVNFWADNDVELIERFGTWLAAAPAKP